MSALVQILEWLFIAFWFVGVSAHLYASRYFLPMWASGFRRKPQHEGYGRKAMVGYAVFVGAVLAGLAVGGIAQLAGG